MFWRGSTDSELLDKVESDRPILLDMQQGDFVYLHLIVGGSRVPPSDEVRARLQRLVDTSSQRLKAIARVFESRGFQGSISRGIAASTDPPTAHYTRKSFDNLNDAAHWLGGILGHDESWCIRLVANVSDQRKLLKTA